MLWLGQSLPIVDPERKLTLFINIWGEEKGKHARTAIGVAELPLNSPVEVEVIFELKA